MQTANPLTVTHTNLFGIKEVCRHRTPKKAQRSAAEIRAAAREKAHAKQFKPNPFRQPIAAPDETEFRHMHWQAARDRVRAALVAAGTGATALARYDNCGAECLVEWSDTANAYRLRASYCHCRHCRPCANARAGLISRNLRTRLETHVLHPRDSYRFITLTLRHSTQPLHDQIRHLNHCFARLRNSKIWTNTQVGGVSMFECHHNGPSGWHPHLHIIAEGGYMKLDKLRAEWSRITGGSTIVDIKQMSSAKDAVHYVSKYVTKGTKDETWADPATASEYVIAMRGVRTAGTYGSWRGFKLLQPPTEQLYKDWRPIGLLTRICDAARNGSQVDLLLLQMLGDAFQYDPSKPRKRRETTQ